VQRLRVLVVSVVIASAFAKATEPGPPTVASESGCYEIRIGEWLPAADLGADNAYRLAPHFVELTSEHLFGDALDDRLVVRPIAGSVLRPHRSAYWELVSAGRIAITFTNGHSGLSINVQIASEGGKGVAATFWDFP